MKTLYIYERLISLENPFKHTGAQIGIVTGRTDEDCINAVKNSKNLKHTYNNSNFVYSFDEVK